jgi:hypothetical protein
MTWQWRRRHRQFHDDEFTTLLRDGTAVQLSSDLHRETVTSSDLSTALEVDHREARDLLSRLLPEESARAAFDSEGARLEGVELVNARPCFRIGRVYPTPDPARHAAVTWWIDSESFLLRRSLRVVEFQDRTLRTTTAFEPELDPTLSPADFTPIEL